jgi:N-acetylmuramoyl-L-alanine amidase
MKYIVTAGHGGNDPGAVAHGFKEAELMTELRDLVAIKLRSSGHTAVTDGERWQNLPLAHAMLLIPGSACAVELHTNAFGSPLAGGVECISLPRDRLMAQRIAQAVARVLETKVRGDRGWIDQSQSARGRLGFVRAGGIVVETFFITNLDELNKFQARKWLVASAIMGAMTA